MTPISFDDVLPALIKACEAWQHERRLRKIAVIRDLRGRVRLAVELDEGTKEMLKELETRVQAALGPWFAGDLVCTTLGEKALQGVAQRVMGLASDWPEACWIDENGERRDAPLRWKKMERRVGKLPWLEGPVEPPWPGAENTPILVAFYSFKGGVGRTTTLASCAIQAARQGERVALLDLDLEAPGVGSLFEVDDSRGLLDLLVEHLATDQIDVEPCLQRSRLPLGDWLDRIEVLPAGRLGAAYLEKLARLDFSSTLSEHEGDAGNIPVRKALLALLEQLCRRSEPPRWIFLDARAGLHDLAGLSLHGLAHVDVLFSRANAQGTAGLDVVLGALARRQRGVASRIVLVHAMAPVSVPDATAERERFQAKTHELFRTHGLYRAPGIPEVSSPDAMHRPWTLPRNEYIERNDRLSDLVGVLSAEPYARLWEKIKESAASQSESAS
jgi:hypothetical protein